MKYIALLDTSVMSFNIGDQIIMESARKGLASIIDNNFVVNFPTHSPLFHWWELSLRHKDSLSTNLAKLDLKFVCGTNLLEKNMKKRKNTWNMHRLDGHYIRDFILVGVGTDGLNSITNKYTEKLYKTILSNKYIHSTRDENTKKFLNSLGFEAINTGCPTLWKLNDRHCKSIPTMKSDKVVFTITDYMPDRENDRKMIDILLKNYKQIFCWLQGSQDIDYLKEIDIGDSKGRIQYIAPSLEAYDNFLDNNECDYVGTRLHAGIKAMQKKHRAIIIGVDNRARDMNETYNLNYLERNNIRLLTEMIYSKIETRINIDEGKIESFLKQFI